MNPWIENFLLSVTPSGKTRVGARKVRQWACPRFTSILWGPKSILETLTLLEETTFNPFRIKQSIRKWVRGSEDGHCSSSHLAGLDKAMTVSSCQFWLCSCHRAPKQRQKEGLPDCSYCTVLRTLIINNVIKYKRVWRLQLEDVLV
jgi:hypothetical protein